MLQDIWQFIRQKPFDAGLYVFVAIVLLLVAQLYFSVSDDDGNWEQYKITHHCRYQDNGKGKSVWICDDGKEYYRWRQQR